jgi:hypothetical protein
VTAWVIVSVVVIPLALSEFSEISPWMAQRMLTWAARHVGDPRQAERYREEWLAGLQDVPGKLTKLVKAISISFYMVPIMNWHYKSAVYLWPARRLADTFLTLTFPRFRQRLLVKRVGLYSVWIGERNREGGAAATVNDVLETLKSAAKVTGGRRILPESERVPGTRNLVVEVDHKRKRAVLHGLTVARQPSRRPGGVN